MLWTCVPCCQRGQHQTGNEEDFVSTLMGTKQMFFFIRFKSILTTWGEIPAESPSPTSDCKITIIIFLDMYFLIILMSKCVFLEYFSNEWKIYVVYLHRWLPRLVTHWRVTQLTGNEQQYFLIFQIHLKANVILCNVKAFVRNF